MQIQKESLDTIFNTARTYPGWLNTPVEDNLLKQVYELMKLGPTSMNCCPARIVFVKSKEAKERLKPCLAPFNVDKTMAAPVTAIVAYDLHFYEKMDVLWPHADAVSIFKGNDSLISETALRNGSLQGAYLIIAARSLGLDCGPMSGFNAAKLDQEFFPEGILKSNFLCNLGYGDPTSLYPRGARLAFDTVCEVL
ncbi:malonic semialdehyde reductase [Candidatus Bodocaedibacter vickermanii]|uniref:Putative NADH dehydrogenase/NAD(P)H nitroreductase CPBP_00575 n=1 Tax=Candidatus Bodocaedibacter vickermanii TaxID=2741701 RepID=A0A7L9RTB4_9PROT|nr:putative malonic semialdehyde reductase RutE [Candidatus Paracaedibacteraceae bacterium 'Lake Konstanz']